MKFFVTTRCNFAHRLHDGKPLDHECEIIPPRALAAEMAGDYERAIDIIEAAKALGPMLTRGLPIHRGIRTRKEGEK